ncbi:MAG TPA: hypothetical protein VME63_05110 [Dyella sp.]|uniref:hypothetical protein n=1 Tax=Dyella sp. TaxID=1869338 RepID=UPI002BF05477|nr:hypothetical protein [Dyella sp.]HTV84759.1 hypothetical protein [Dyella sp.]
MFGITPHVPTHVAPHPLAGSESHPKLRGSEGDAGTHSLSALVTPGTAGFSSSPASGRASGLLAKFDKPDTGYESVKLPGDTSDYAVKSDSGTGRSRSLLKFHAAAGAYKQTSKQVVRDGSGAWTLDTGLPGGGQKSTKHASSSRDDGDQGSGYETSTTDKTPLFGKSSGRSQAGHSFSDRSTWNNASTGAKPVPSTSSRAASSFKASKAATFDSYVSGPFARDWRIKDSGDGKSKNWVIEDGKGGYAPGDSSLDSMVPVRIWIGGPDHGKGYFKENAKVMWPESRAGHSSGNRSAWSNPGTVGTSALPGPSTSSGTSSSLLARDFYIPGAPGQFGGPRRPNDSGSGGDKS